MYSVGFYIGLILIGVFAGFVSGLLGVGGFLMVPLQYFLLSSEGIDPSLAMVVSVATSLAIIIPTASTGAYRHQKVNKDIVKPGIALGIFGIVGSFAGGLLAVYIPTYYLQIVFSILLIGVAINMIRGSLKDAKEDSNDSDDGESSALIGFNVLAFVCVGFAVGILSGLLGVGGGIFIIPILTMIFGFKLTKAIGTSSVYISLTAIGGVISYIYSGWAVNPLSFSLGYVSLINWILIVLFSVPMASLGAKLVYKVPEKKLKIVFAILIFFIAAKMLGLLPF